MLDVPYLEVYFLDAGDGSVFVGGVLESGIESLGVLQQVDDRVETVEQTQGVGAEDTTSWIIDVVFCEEWLSLRLEFDQPDAQTPVLITAI